MVLVVPEQSQRPYRFGMTLLCVGALFNWLGLADTYSDPVPAIRYIGVGLIAAGASLICMAMCFWMRNIHDPNSNGDYDVSSDPIHMISSDPSLEKPPEYSTVVDVPPCYEDAVKLSATPIMFRLKQALTSSGHLVNQNVDINDATNTAAASKNYAEQNHLLAATLATDGQSFPALTADSACKQTKKCAPAPSSSLADVSLAPSSSHSQNSSQNENTLAKVFRKSIRGIRRYRSGSEDSNNSLEQAQASNCNLENGPVQVKEASTGEFTKVDR